MIKTWRDRVPDNLNLYRTCVTYPQQLMQAEIDELRAAIATARKDERERCAKTAELGWHYGTANAIRNLIDEG